MKRNIIKFHPKSTSTAVLLLLLTMIGGCGSTGTIQIDEDTFYQLEADVQNVLASPVADAAPLEMKFIKEKLVLAKEAKASRKRKLEAQLTEQIYADIKIARMRAELNQLNNELLDKRDQVSAARLYLSELQERLQ
ncbi:DUF4398 domain-containing protein [Marinicella sediminis]|uniref:DUF4398 domain-containing protein n=1 Tax=Marinicella sediminis TaxID=1792834 RepID=A0ABV7J8M0_9GAMM|nr:DUF4398 domain-containing protein [Marinicella sediminis]